MNYLAKLEDEEIRYICNSIPFERIKYYFQRYPKEFAKVRPGFRPNTIKEVHARDILFSYRKRDFIANFIEQKIESWLDSISVHLEDIIKNGGNRDTALMKTLPFSYFADNISIYFKLIDEEHSAEYMTLLDKYVQCLKETDNEKESLNKELSEKNAEITKMINVYKSIDDSLNVTKSKLDEISKENAIYKNQVADYKQTIKYMQKDKQTIETLVDEKKDYEEKINYLKLELLQKNEKIMFLEESIILKSNEQTVATNTVSHSYFSPVRPVNMEEFKEHIGFNFEDLGVDSRQDYFYLLIDYLAKILFQGRPIICQATACKNIAQCVANTITGKSDIDIIVFDKSISAKEIEEFIHRSERIVCLDNFIGNFNETELLPVFHNNKNKMIWLTNAYDKTLCYLPEQFLLYCQYLSVGRIGALLTNQLLTEDPSILEEDEFGQQRIYSGNRHSGVLRKIMRELGFSINLIEQKCDLVIDESDLCQTLAFDVLPYCIDVLRISPYNTSEQLVRYAGDKGRCPQKTLFLEWFS